MSENTREHMCRRHQISFSICLLMVVYCAQSKAAETTNMPPEVLSNAVQVLDLTAAQAAQALPVILHGVVVDESEPREKALILQDDSASVYTFADTNIFAPFHRMDELIVKGVTSAGEFAPCVLTKEVEVMKIHGDTPKAQPATYQQLITGALDAQYVKVTGVVRECLPPLKGDSTWRIVLAADGGTIPVRIPLPQNPQVKEDSEVTVEAVCLYEFNYKRQLLGPVLQVPRGASVTIRRLAPEEPYATPIRSAVSLLQYSREFPMGHRVHVRGVVTRSDPGSKVWIRDASSGLRIQVSQVTDVQPGDEIDALGFPEYGYSAPVLQDAVIQKIQPLPSPPPLQLTNPAEAYDHQDDLVALNAILTDIQVVQNGLLLTLESDRTEFRAILKLPLKPNIMPDWQRESSVRVAGICDVIPDDSRPVMGIWHPQLFQILLRSPADVTILRAPSWWNARHIMLILGIFTALSLTVSGVVVLLARQRLQQQARRRAMAEAEFAAILAERNRLAREIHDTLAQGLTATAVQLQLVEIHANGTSATLKDHLTKARQMVRDSLEEARNSIWNMRPQVLETGDLPEALKHILAQLSQDNVQEAHFDIVGRQRRLPAVIENNVLRLGQEAITNAIRHANAKRIDVRLEFGEKHFSMLVSDDGLGFDPDNPPKSKGGFGLVAMQQRANELGGILKIESAPNRGTRINLNIPLAGE